MDSKKTKSIISICAMSFLTLASSATSPALATISRSFPEASSEAIASIATISSLTAVPFTIISGLLIGKKVKFRLMASIGLLISAIGGIMPFFAESMTQILVGRAILGIGNGLLYPIVSTLTLSLFFGEDVAKQFGRNMIATNIGAVLFQLIGGFLCNYGWKVPFLAYFAILPVFFIVVLLLPEPTKIITKDGTAKDRLNKICIGDVLTRHVVLWGFLHALYMIFFYPFVTETSGIIAREGYGNAMTTAVILSLFTAAGVLGGSLFYRINRRFGLKTLAIGFGISTISYIWLFWGNSVWDLTFASISFGVGYGILGPAINYNLGIKIKPEVRSASVAAESLFSHIGSFGSPFVLSYLKNMTNTNVVRFSFLAGAVFFTFATLGFLLTKKDKLKK